MYDEKEQASEVYLEAIVVTFDDMATTGIGLTSFSTLQLYNVYTLAINDRPCTVFAGEVSDGCREQCASPILTSSCQIIYSDTTDPIDNAGNPYDILKTIVRTYREDDVEAVKLGGMVVKPVDLYDSRYALMCTIDLREYFSCSCPTMTKLTRTLLTLS